MEATAPLLLGQLKLTNKALGLLMTEVVPGIGPWALRVWSEDPVKVKPSGSVSVRGTVAVKNLRGAGHSLIPLLVKQQVATSPARRGSV